MRSSPSALHAYAFCLLLLHLFAYFDREREGCSSPERVGCEDTVRDKPEGDIVEDESTEEARLKDLEFLDSLYDSPDKQKQDSTYGEKRAILHERSQSRNPFGARRTRTLLSFIQLLLTVLQQGIVITTSIPSMEALRRRRCSTIESDAVMPSVLQGEPQCISPLNPTILNTLLMRN